MTGQGALVVFFDRGKDQQQPWQVMATIDQADIRGSEPHNHDPSGAGRCEKIGTFLLNTLFAERSFIRAMVRHESF